ncbi:LysR-type transcriptional regulator [Actinobacillus equuli]|nr:LysR-type transcriptional regulator [Actinobacillus equuli]
MPKDLDDLRKNFPFSSLINATTGQPWEIYIDENTVLVPQKLGFITTDLYSELQAALAGRTIAHIGNTICKPYIETDNWYKFFLNNNLKNGNSIYIVLINRSPLLES